ASAVCGKRGFCHLPLQSVQPETKRLSPEGLRDSSGISEPGYGLRLCAPDRKRRGGKACDNPWKTERNRDRHVYHGVHRQFPDKSDRGGDGDAERISI